MNVLERAVIVREVPQKCESGNSRKFLRDLTDAMGQVVRPAVVLDCSKACRIDRQTLILFLSCLEEAMKRNGDVRLAGLHRDALPVLQSAGAGNLFRAFTSTAEAVASYSRHGLDRSEFVAQSATDEPAANAA